MDSTHLDLDLKSEDYTCYGCYLLETGQGGENQLGHMEPGGCLYEEYYYNSDVDTDITIQEQVELVELVPTTKKCIICCDEIKDAEYCNLICNFCQTKENKQRQIRYQTFIANNYAKS